jgi:sugar transferase EpsL
MFAKIAKSLADYIVAAVLLILLMPVMIVLAVLIKCVMGGPVLFRQRRPGLRGAPFVMIKFRTMRDAVDASGKPLPDEQRITPLGEFLRASSLDELPELLNVLKGEMSLVGPRPLMMQYLDRYTQEQARRHDVKPGVTGWAQVNGRNAISWEEKFRLDVWYVDNWSLLLDLKILCLTVAKVVKRDGISAEGMATVSEFVGSDCRK